MGLHFDAVVPPPFDEPAFIHQRVLKHTVEYAYRIVVLSDDVIQIVSRLFTHRHIISGARHELDHLLRAEEHTHHGWQHGLYAVANITTDYLGTTIDLVTERVAPIVFGRFCPDRADVVVYVLDRIGNVGGDHCLQVGLTHPYASFGFSFVYISQYLSIPKSSHQSRRPRGTVRPRRRHRGKSYSCGYLSRPIRPPSHRANPLDHPH